MLFITYLTAGIVAGAVLVTRDFCAPWRKPVLLDVAGAPEPLAAAGRR
jgi:hypothetical protein